MNHQAAGLQQADKRRGSMAISRGINILWWVFPGLAMLARAKISVMGSDLGGMGDGGRRVFLAGLTSGHCKEAAYHHPSTATKWIFGGGGAVEGLAQSLAFLMHKAPVSFRVSCKHVICKLICFFASRVKQGSLKDTFCPFEACCFFNTKIKLETTIYKLQCSGV